MTEYVYAVTGIVHPERADVTISSAGALIGEDGELGRLSFSVFKSRIAGVFRSQEPIQNTRQVAYWVESSVRGITDTLCFTNGCGYDVEIIQIIDIQSNAHQVFGVEDEVISSLKVGDRVSPESIATLYGTIFGRYLQRAFADLREAVRTPGDSGFFCYRAIECLVHYFMFDANDKATTKSEAWLQFRETVNIPEYKFRELKSAADPQRHGNLHEEPSLSRGSVMQYAWEIVEGFILYALSSARS